MKRILFLLFYSIPAISFTQENTSVALPIDSATGKIVFADVIEIPDVSANKLFQLLRNWAVTNTVISDKAILVNDSTNHEITLHCKNELRTADGKSMCNISFVITLYNKEGKYKYLIKNLVHEGCYRGPLLGTMQSVGELERIINSDSQNRRYYDNILSCTKNNCEKLIASLKASVSTTANESNF